MHAKLQSQGALPRRTLPRAAMPVKPSAGATYSGIFLDPIYAVCTE